MRAFVEAAIRLDRRPFPKQAARRVEALERAGRDPAGNLLLDAVVEITDHRAVQVAEQLVPVRIAPDVRLRGSGLPWTASDAMRPSQAVRRSSMSSLVVRSRQLPKSMTAPMTQGSMPGRRAAFASAHSRARTGSPFQK